MYNGVKTRTSIYNKFMVAMKSLYTDCKENPYSRLMTTRNKSLYY